MTDQGKHTRRGFVGAALVGVGVAAGALVRRSQDPGDAPVPGADDGKGLTPAYDVSEFEKTDPRQILHRERDGFETGLGRVKRICPAPGGGLWVAGERIVRRFTAQGKVEQELTLERPVHCVHVAGPDELFIGLGTTFALHDSAGRIRYSSPPLGEKAFVTSMVVHGSSIYVADAGNREIVVCDRTTGQPKARFGRKNQPQGAPGFVVPSPYFDLGITKGERLRVANPGRLRVETYTLDGRFESSFGEPGMALDRFCGCCNPVYLTETPDGRIITSEKGLARIKVYSPTGQYQGVVAGPDRLVDDRELAKKACADCRVGAGFDVAAADNGQLWVLDPFRMKVRVFEPLSTT